MAIPSCGSGEISVNLSGGEERIHLADGNSLIRARGIIIGNGCGREKLISAMDRAAKLAAEHRSGDGILKITVCSPAVLKSSGIQGHDLFEQEIEILYIGVR